MHFENYLMREEIFQWFKFNFFIKKIEYNWMKIKLGFENIIYLVLLVASGLEIL